MRLHLERAKMKQLCAKSWHQQTLIPKFLSIENSSAWLSLFDKLSTCLAFFLLFRQMNCTKCHYPKKASDNVPQSLLITLHMVNRRGLFFGKSLLQWGPTRKTSTSSFEVASKARSSSRKDSLTPTGGRSTLLSVWLATTTYSTGTIQEEGESARFRTSTLLLHSNVRKNVSFHPVCYSSLLLLWYTLSNDLKWSLAASMIVIYVL